MLLQVRRFASALIVALLAFTLYAFTVARWIEPPLAASRTSTVQRPKTTGLRQRERVKTVFQPGDWELHSPKVLEAEQGLLFLQDYETLPEGRIRIRPCTLVFFTPGSDVSPGDKKPKAPPKATTERAFVVRAPEGAILQFDRELDMSRPNMGRLIGGRLVGDVKITSPESSPGENDALEIATRQVQIDRERVWTTDEVRFRFGPHHGAGRDLTVFLEPEENPDDDDDLPEGENKESSADSVLRGVRFMELVHVDELELQAPAGKGLLGNESAASSASVTGAAPRTTPVEIACRGPFQFDFVNKVASFEDRVDVLRTSLDGPSDQLNCERLEIHLGKVLAAPSAPRPSTSTDSVGASDKLSGLEIQKIVALGQPVILRAPASDASGRGDRLEYDFQKQEVMLASARQATFEQGSHRIVARSLRYGLAHGGLGTLRAAGPGELAAGGEPVSSRGAAGPSSPQPEKEITIRWNRKLFLRPAEGGHLASLDGGASAALGGMGGFSAREIHFWFRELKDQPSPSSAGMANSASGMAKSRSRFQPDRMMARGQVEIATRQLTGLAGQLEVWFEDDSAAGADQDAPATVRPLAGSQEGSPASGIAAAWGKPADETAPRRKFHVAGELIQVQLVSAGAAATSPGRRSAETVGALQGSSRRYSPREIIIEGGAEFGEIGAAADAPLAVSGATIHAFRLDRPDAFVKVLGEASRPAAVSAGGMRLAGGNLQIDQGENRLWINGPGEVSFPPPRRKPADATGDRRPLSVAAPSGQVTVEWSGKLSFDGRVVHIERDVQVQSGQGTLRCARLDATTSQRVDFAQHDGAEVELRHLACDGGVQLENRSYDEFGQLASVEELNTRNLTIDQWTGDVRADGAGDVLTVRREKGQPQGGQTLGGGLALARLAPGGGDRPAADRPLTYLRIQFEDGLTGNHLPEKRHIAFHQRVQAVHGPVSDWRQRLNPDDADGLGEKGVVLTCDELTVTEFSPSVGTATSADRPIEIEAAGDAVVESQSFTARAARLSYSLAKEMLVLEGDGRSDAEIWRRTRGGGPGIHTAARKMTYLRGRDHVLLDAWEGGEITGLVPQK